MFLMVSNVISLTMTSVCDELPATLQTSKEPVSPTITSINSGKGHWCHVSLSGCGMQEEIQFLEISVLLDEKDEEGLCYFLNFLFWEYSRSYQAEPVLFKEGSILVFDSESSLSFG